VLTTTTAAAAVDAADAAAKDDDDDDANANDATDVVRAMDEKMIEREVSIGKKISAEDIDNEEECR